MSLEIFFQHLNLIMIHRNDIQFFLYRFQYVRVFTNTSRVAKQLGNFAKWRIVYPCKARAGCHLPDGLGSQISALGDSRNLAARIAGSGARAVAEFAAHSA